MMAGEKGSDDLLELVFGAVYLEPPMFESNPIDHVHLPNTEPVFHESNNDETNRRASVDSHMTSVSQQRGRRRISTASSEATSHTSEDTLTLIDDVVKAKTAAQKAPQIGKGATVNYQSDIEHNVVNELVRIEKVIHDQQAYNASIDGSVVSNKNADNQVKTGGSHASMTHSTVKKSNKAASVVSTGSSAMSPLSETVFNPNGISDDDHFNEHDVSTESHRIQNIIDTQRRASQVNENGIITTSYQYQSSSHSDSHRVSEHVERSQVVESHGAHLETSNEVVQYANVNGFHTVDCEDENSISHHITEISQELVQQDAHGNITSRQSVSAASGVARSDILSEHSVVRSPLTDSLVQEFKHVNGLRHIEDDDDNSSCQGNETQIPYEVELSDSDDETVITLRSAVQKDFDSDNVITIRSGMIPEYVQSETSFADRGHASNGAVENRSVVQQHVENESQQEVFSKTESELEFKKFDITSQNEEHSTTVHDKTVMNEVDVVTTEHEHDNTSHYNAYEVDEASAGGQRVEMESISDFGQQEETFLEDHIQQSLGGNVNVNKEFEYEDHTIHREPLRGDHVYREVADNQLETHSLSNASQEEEFETYAEVEEEDEFQREDMVPEPFPRPASPLLNMLDARYANEDGNLTLRLVPHTVGPKVTEALRSVSREELMRYQANAILHQESHHAQVQTPIHDDSISEKELVNAHERTSSQSTHTERPTFTSEEYILSENVKALRNRFENGNIDNRVYDEEVDAVFKQLDNTLSSKTNSVVGKSRSETTSTVRGSQVSAVNEARSVTTVPVDKHSVKNSTTKSSSRRSSKSGKGGNGTVNKSRSTTLQSIDENAVLSKPTSLPLEVFIGPPVLPILSQTPITSPNYSDKHQSVRVVKSVRQFVQKWGSPDFVPPHSPVIIAHKSPQSPALIKEFTPSIPVRTSIPQPRRDSVMSDATSVSVHSSVSQKSGVSVKSSTTAKPVQSHVSQGNCAESIVTNTTFTSSKVCSRCGRCGKRDGKKVSKSANHQKRPSVDSNVTITEETAKILSPACYEESEVTEMKIRGETVVLTKLTPVSERRIMFEEKSSGHNRNFPSTARTSISYRPL